MFSTADTIVAIATPPGRGGIGVVRVSGAAAERIARDLTDRTKPFSPRRSTFAGMKGVRPRNSPSDGANQRQASVDVRDRVVVTYFKAPASYTGEDVVEISAHGSPVVLNGIVRAAVDAGARLAEPGEFTLRAFLNHKIDLIQAEAVADLIDAVTPLQARAAFDQLEGTLTHAIAEIERDLFDVVAKLEASLDFPEEGYHFIAPRDARDVLARLSARIDALLAQAARGRLIREGAQVAIVGAPNVGKSSLFNALLNTNRAIVTAIPGTTRDVLTERADIGGLALSLIDTAGVRETIDVVEQEGVLRARDTIRVADLVLVVLDRSRELSDDDGELLGATVSRPRVLVLNKSDLSPALLAKAALSLPPTNGGRPEPDRIVEVSAKTGAGIDRLIDAIADTLTADEPLRDQPQITNTRHATLIERAGAAINRAAAALEDEISEEFPLLDLQDAAHALQEVTGRRTSDDLLRHIFERFCIGK
jgi:tRNA modification GTPase